MIDGKAGWYKGNSLTPLPCGAGRRLGRPQLREFPGRWILVVVQIQPTVTFHDRCGICSSTRQILLQKYPRGIPDDVDWYQLATELYNWENNQRGFMSFSLVQLGQASASLGEGELAYHCLRHLVNRFWLNNLASMHNHRSLLNMDISGGMPAVIIKMLVASDVGKIQLLPALPAAWPSGRIEGVACRGAIVIQSLQWDGKHLSVTMSCVKSQKIILELPAEIAQLSVTGDAAQVSLTQRNNERLIALSSGQRVAMVITLK